MSGSIRYGCAVTGTGSDMCAESRINTRETSCDSGGSSALRSGGWRRRGPGESIPHSEHPVSIAPMMDRTDRHYRWFARLMTRRVMLYTEMVATGAILYGDRERHLGFDPIEHPVALQLGGAEVSEVAEATRLAEPYAYDEINLNIGCPSDRVQERGIGACLMRDPEHVARLVEAARRNTSKPVTVKCRIGVNGKESYDDLVRFVQLVRKAGPARFTVHARIAVLGGLNPKENRDVPPLRYEDVYRLKCDFPEVDIEINGGVTSVHQVREHLQHVDRVMIGRAAYDRPALCAELEVDLFGEEPPCATRREVIEELMPYVEAWNQAGHPANRIVRHTLGLVAGRPGARAWRRLMSGRLPYQGRPLLERALRELPRDTLDEPLVSGASLREREMVTGSSGQASEESRRPCRPRRAGDSLLAGIDGSHDTAYQ